MSPVSKEILSGLVTGINSEIASYVFYLEAAKRSETAQFQDVLKQLAAEEKQHFHVLERQHNSLIKSEQWVSTADIMKAEGLPEINEEMSSAHKELIEEVRKAPSVQVILDIAHGLEEDAYQLFMKLEGQADSDEARKMFADLARFEQGHMRKINKMREELA